MGVSTSGRRSANCQLEGVKLVYNYVHGICRGFNRQRLGFRGILEDVVTFPNIFVSLFHQYCTVPKSMMIANFPCECSTLITFNHQVIYGTKYAAILLFLNNYFIRALSLRSLVSGSECGRVFPAGVGPGSPWRDAVNWRSSRFSRSVETRRRYGWLRMVLPGARLFRAPIWCSSGGGGTREAGSTVAESLVALYRVGAHQIRRGWRAARSSTSQGSAEPLCARIEGANREVSERKANL